MNRESLGRRFKRGAAPHGYSTMRRITQLRSLRGVGTGEAPERVAAAWCGPGDFTALLEDLQVLVDAFMYDIVAEYR